MFSKSGTPSQSSILTGGTQFNQFNNKVQLKTSFSNLRYYLLKIPSCNFLKTVIKPHKLRAVLEKFAK